MSVQATVQAVETQVSTISTTNKVIIASVCTIGLAGVM